MRFVLLALMALLLVGCMGSPTTTLTNEEQAVVDRIGRLTDCGELQRQFDLADSRNKVVYMEAAHERMQAVGCYG